jgi:hypothetical protein
MKIDYFKEVSEQQQISEERMDKQNRLKKLDNANIVSDFIDTELIFNALEENFTQEQINDFKEFFEIEVLVKEKEND